MSSLQLEISSELEAVLMVASEKTGKPASELALRGLKNHLEDMEEYSLAHESASEFSATYSPTYSLDEVSRELGLDD